MNRPRRFGEMEYSMKKKFVQLAACGLAAALALSLTAALPRASAADDGQMIRVGLYYSSDALDGANLANETGSGFRLGYFNSANEFVQLASTADESISVVKTENVYYGTYNNYTSYHDAAVSGTVVGCYHLELPGSYATAQEAQLVVNNYEDGFVAWIQGAFYARVGNFPERSGAEERQAELAGSGVEATIVGTSGYGVSVVNTGTNHILFQYDDGGAGTGLGVMPNAAAGGDYTTWFRNIAWRGGFRYQRVDGGDLTIVNMVQLDDYIKGVVPHEMSNSWHLEALKAQAVCARTYALRLMGGNRHGGQFDLCNESHCQVYLGTSGAGANSDRAVDETAGEVATYNGAYIDAVYYSSNGGASIDSSIPWGGNQSSYPYLVGVEDPYEALVADRISGYEWTRSYTGNQLRDVVRDAGYTSCSTVASAEIATYTDAGLPRQIRFTDVNGKSYTISTAALVKWFGLRSYNYWFEGSGDGGSGNSGQIYVNGQPVDGLDGLYAIGADGNPVALGDGSYVIDGSGQTSAMDSGTGSGSVSGAATSENGTFTISGRGWGHNVGLSQWGAYAQAQAGRTYKEILTFYYTGITVG